MIKLLLLNYEFPPLGGGSSPISYDVAKKLSETGEFDIDVITMSYKGLDSYEEVNNNFRVFRVKSWRSKKAICHPWEQATFIYSGYKKAIKLHKEKKYDICHSHFLIPTGIIAYRLKKRFGLKYVLTAHGSDVPGFNNDRFIFLHKFTGPILRAVSKNASIITSPSIYLKNLILNNISNELKNSIVHIPNAIETNDYQPFKKKKIILSTGRLLARKGFQYLIEAVSQEDIKYEVHICGDGPMMNKLKEMAKKSKTKIILHGWLDNKSKKYKDLLKTASIYVLASLKENGSIALLEGMSSGSAVITTNISGCPETVGKEGILVNPGDIGDLKEKINFLVNDEIKLKETQKAMRKRTEKFFDWSVVLKKYIEILSKKY